MGRDTEGEDSLIEGGGGLFWVFLTIAFLVVTSLLSTYHASWLLCQSLPSSQVSLLAHCRNSRRN